MRKMSGGGRPTRRVPAETLRNAARDIEEVLEARYPPGDSGETTATTNRAMLLGAIGSWTSQRSYRMTQCATDKKYAAEAAFQLGAKPIRARRSFNEGECTHMRYVEMLTHRSILPCALLALYLEQLYMLNLEALAKLRGMTPWGGIVDCLYCCTLPAPRKRFLRCSEGRIGSISSLRTFPYFR